MEESKVEKQKSGKQRTKREDNVTQTDSESNNEVEKTSNTPKTSDKKQKKEDSQVVTKKSSHRKKKNDSDEEDLGSTKDQKAKRNERTKKGNNADKKDQRKSSDKDEKKKTKEEDGEDDSSSAEDLNKVNKIFFKTPTFKSLKDLIHGKRYRCGKFELVNTTKGDRIRIQLVDKEFHESMVFVHLPERINLVLIPKLDSYNTKCASPKPIFLIYRGLKGKAFDVRFTRKPK